MKTHLSLFKNKIIGGILFLLFITGFANGQTEVKVTLFDNTEQSYSVTTTGKLWFNGSDLIIDTINALTPITIPLADIKKITFDENSGTSGVNEAVKHKEVISIFPNPTKNYFELETSGAGKLNVHIFNTNGTLVASGTYASGDRVDITQLTAGLYVIVINNQSFKLIKQ